MRIGVLACDALKKEIETIIAGEDDIVYKEYLEFGLHLQPDELKQVILGKLAALEGKVDVVFLGYAYCQSLQGVPKMVKVPTVMLEQEDCICTLLTPERYVKEKKCGRLTWFYPAGWAEYGMPGIVKLFRLDTAEEYPPEFFLRIMFDGFKRCLFIDTGMEGAGRCENCSKDLAKMLDLTPERTTGELTLMRSAWEKTKDVGKALDAGDLEAASLHASSSTAADAPGDGR